MNSNKFIVAGQVVTSRLEALEWYLCSSKANFISIGFPSPFAKSNVGYIKSIKDGVDITRKNLYFSVIQAQKIVRYAFMPVTFISYFIGILYQLFKRPKNGGIYIGIATFATTCGVVAKKLGFVDSCIYYCLDYYPPPSKLSFLNYLYNKIYQKLDKFCVSHSDLIWDISPEISVGRKYYSNFDDSNFPITIVPLGYADDVNRFVDIEYRVPYSLGFVGTVSDNQGLELVLDAMVILRNKYPSISLHLIGSGPHYDNIKSYIGLLGLKDNVKLYGFVKDDEVVYDILANCQLGVATWNGSESDNSRYADPGKPKLYALLGLPIIITKFPIISRAIAESGVGEVIDYQVDELVSAIDKIFSNRAYYCRLVDRLDAFKINCRARNIFDIAFALANINLSRSE